MRLLDLCRVVERSNISLAFSPSSCSSSFFLSRLETDVASSSRDSLCRAHAGAVDEKLQRLDKRFKMSVQRDALLDPIDLQSAMFLANRLVFSISLAIFSCSCTCYVRLWLSLNWSRYGTANSLNPFLYRPFVSVLSLSITRNPFFAANSRDITRKIRTTCRYSHDHCKWVSSWYRPV